MNRTLAVLAIPVLLAGCSAVPAGPVRVEYVGAVSSLGAVVYTDPDGKPVSEQLPEGGTWGHSITAQPGTVLRLLVGDKRGAGAWCSILVDGKTVADDTDAQQATCSYTVPK